MRVDAHLLHRHCDSSVWPNTLAEPLRSVVGDPLASDLKPRRLAVPWAKPRIPFSLAAAPWEPPPSASVAGLGMPVESVHSARLLEARAVY